MSTIVVTIVIITSLSGLGMIVSRKIPVLINLPKTIKRPPKKSLAQSLKKKIKKTYSFEKFSYEIFLQKILSKIRVLNLKAEHKISVSLQKLRKKQKEKKINKEDNYWDKIKKTTKSK